MGNPSDDLDRFLRSEGRRILMESGEAPAKPYEPLTCEDIDDFAHMNLENLDKDALKDLLYKAEELRDALEEQEPEDQKSEEHSHWEALLSEVEDFVDRVREYTQFITINI